MMNLINNRYRVFKKLNQNRLISTYLVSDIMNNFQSLQLNIFNSEQVFQELREFFLNEFSTLSNLCNEDIIKVYEFGIINLVDNKKTNGKQYFYTCDSFENNRTIIDFVQTMESNEILQVFLKVCRVIYYLHLNNFVYGDLNLNTLLVNDQEEGFSVRLKDIVTMRLKKYNYWELTEKDFFKAPEAIKGAKLNKVSDIYSLGVLLLVMLRKNAENNLNIKNEIGNIKKLNIKGDYNGDLLYKLINIIEKMTSENLSNRYSNIYEVVKEINEKLGTDYRLIDRKEIEKLNFNIKMCGRKKQIEAITNEYNFLKDNNKNKFVFVHGDAGIGKTNFLKHIHKTLELKKANIYSSFALDNISTSSNKAFIEILKKIIMDSSEDTIERYEMHPSKIVPVLEEYKNVSKENCKSNEKERIRLYNRILGFIYEFIKERNVVIIIDNLHLASELVFEILEYMYSKGLGGKKFMFIASYPETECVENKRVMRFINEVRKNYDVLDVPLQGFSREETSEMVKSLLGSAYLPKGLSSKIYSLTYGNPLFIQESIKEFFLRKLIFINEENGLWSMNYDDNKMTMSSNLEQFILNQISEIDNINCSIINTISIFNEPVCYETIEAFQLYTAEKSLPEVLDNLVTKGLLRKKIDEKGQYYELCNKVLKNLIYTKMDVIERHNKHKTAARILEDFHKNQVYEDKEELIFHLEEAGDKEKVVKYCVENADNMAKFNFNDAALRSLKKALNILSDGMHNLESIQLLIKVAKIYSKDGNNSLAIEHFMQAIELSEEISEYSYYVDALNEIANIHSRKNENRKALEFIGKVENALLKTEYLKGYLRAKEIEVSIYCRTNQYDKAYDTCIKSLELCDDKHLSYKGVIYNLLGNIHSYNAKTEEALDCYNKGMEYLKDSSYIQGYLSVLNNLAVTYGDCFQDDKKCIEYFSEMLEISEKKNVPYVETYALINLGATYTGLHEYSLSRDYFIRGLSKARKREDECNIFFCYVNLMFIELMTGNFSEAYDYYLLVEREIKEYPDQGSLMGIYYQFSGEFYFAFGELKRAKEFAEQALKGSEGINILQTLEVKTLIEFINIYNKEFDKDVTLCVENVIKIIEDYESNISKAYVQYSFSIALYENGHIDEARKLFNTEYFKKDEIKVPWIYVKELYMKGLLENGVEKKNYLKSALRCAKTIKNNIMYFKICDAVGDYYFSRKEYFYAVNYYFEACEIIKDLTMQIPLEHRLSYMNTFGMVKPFNKITLIKSHTGFISSKYLNELNTKVSNEKDIEKLFEYGDFIDILSNRHFIKSAKRIYKSVLPEGINGVKDIIKYLGEDALKNLDLIARYVASTTLATRAVIVMDNTMGIQVLASSDGNKELLEIEKSINVVKETREPLIMNNNFIEKNLELANSIKAAMCIPIILHNEESTKNRKTRNTNVLSQIKGYLYVESERIVNNINEGTMKKCSDLIALMGVVIDKYQFKIGSSIDKLTGAFTRKFLDESLIEQLEKANSFGEKLSIIMFDLDNFKGINDRFGHQTGDAVLEKVCKEIMASIRQEDLCGRYGGEEFIVILPNTDTTEALKVAERLRDVVEKKRILGEKRDVTISMGIASFPDQAQWKQDLIEKADQALYVAKEKGRNRCELWSHEFSDKMKMNNQLSGIISGNSVEDSRRVLVIVQLLDLIKSQGETQEKIYNILGRIIEITESQNGILFTIDNENISEVYVRKNFIEGWTELKGFNKEMVNNVLKSRQGIYKIDWDEIVAYDAITGMPDWQSIIIVPLIKNEKLKGILYLSASLKDKEFKFEDFNFVNTLGEITIGVLN